MDLYAIWSERNTAVRECNMAVAEKRQAMADRDMAILQRDAAFADRDNARKQRDDAIAQVQLKSNLMNGSGVQLQMKDNLMNVGSVQLQLRNNSMNPRCGMIHDYSESGVNHSLSESGVIHNLSENGVIHNPQGVKELSMVPKQQQRRQHVVNYSEIAFKPVEVPFSDVFGKSTTTASKSMKARKGKNIKETKTVSHTKAVKPVRETKTVSPKRVSKPVRETKTLPTAKVLKPTRKISKRTTRISNKPVTVAVSNHASSDNGTSGRSGNLEKQIALKGGLSLNELGLDYDNLPVPFCSCTGNPQSCYKWGKGGWQSACCTTTMSMYPLPQMPNKRHSRMGGRKMSGGAFTKLIIRLASEGQNITAPIDLKNHWARHGTNRYIIIR